jgi:hypothetical protein
MKKINRKSHYPKWAKYKAIDLCGEVWLFSKKPSMTFYVWFQVGGHVELIKIKENYKGDWTKSLRKIKD